jgi:hypothetical protein
MKEVIACVAIIWLVVIFILIHIELSKSIKIIDKAKGYPGGGIGGISMIKRKPKRKPICKIHYMADRGVKGTYIAYSIEEIDMYVKYIIHSDKVFTYIEEY